MSVLLAIQQACAAIGLEIPSKVYGSTEREHIELQMIVSEVTDFIWNANEWQSLQAKATIIGEGISGPYQMPCDFGRFLDDGLVYSNKRQSPLSHNVDSTEWLLAENKPGLLLNPMWRVSGDQLFVLPSILETEEISFYYVKSIDPISQDWEDFCLSERLLRLGIIWQWKANKGLPYAEEMQSYEIALSQAIAIDRGPNALKTGLQPAIRTNDYFVTPADYCP